MMKPVTVLHDASREYVYPSGRKSLRLKLKAARGQIMGCRIVFWNRFYEDDVRNAELERVGSDLEFDYFTCELNFEEATRYIKYYFEILGDEGGFFLGRDGQSTEKPRYFFEYLCTNEEDILDVPDWARGGILYQIFPERFRNGDPSNDPAEAVDWSSMPTRENFFGGDLKGIRMELDHLQELHVEVLYLTPVFKAPSNHKYDTADYYQIDPSFGSTQDLIELVQDCHRRGIRVLLDGVFNHCGYYFEAFQDVMKNEAESRYKDWFTIDSFPVQTDPLNYECVGYYKWMPKLRFKNPEVRKYFLDVGVYWLKTADIDGWRLDVADEVDFTFWQEFRRAVKAVKPDALLIAETWKDGRDLVRGDQMDSVMNYLFRDAVVDYFALDAIDTHQFDHLIQRMYFNYPEVIRPVLYNMLGSHDTARFLEMCKGDIRRMQLAVAFQMTFPGMPSIYYGDEMGMTGENDPDCRRAMNWTEQNKELLAFYHKMTALRKDTPALRYGDFRTILCEGAVYGFARSHESETVYVFFNNSDKEQKVEKGFEMVLPAYHFEIIKTGRK